MDISSTLSSLLVAILSGFLAFSSMAENAIVSSLSFVGYQHTTTYSAPAVEPEEETRSVPLTEGLSVLPSVFEGQEYGGPIPRILIDAPLGASIVLSPSQSEVAGTSSLREVVISPSNVSVADAIVNIFCTLRSKNEIRAMTGSGVFIDRRGVVLTNAHVAQFLLLADEENGIRTKCVLRIGSPATAEYAAELLYISPLWVQANAEELKSDAPSGTGERDYALLYVTESVEGALPKMFPALPYDTNALGNAAKNQAILAAGFPAEILRTSGIKGDLLPVIATTTITELFTYTKNKVDLIGIAPSAVGEGGSSGGPVVTLDGAVIAVISTRGDAKKDGAKSLRAITTAYIDRTIREETGLGLREYLKDQLPERARIFRTTLTPLLSEIVSSALKKSSR